MTEDGLEVPGLRPVRFGQLVRLVILSSRVEHCGSRAWILRLFNGIGRYISSVSVALLLLSYWSACDSSKCFRCCFGRIAVSGRSVYASYWWACGVLKSCRCLIGRRVVSGRFVDILLVGVWRLEDLSISYWSACVSSSKVRRLIAKLDYDWSDFVSYACCCLWLEPVGRPREWDPQVCESVRRAPRRHVIQESLRLGEVYAGHRCCTSVSLCAATCRACHLLYSEHNAASGTVPRGTQHTTIA